MPYESRFNRIDSTLDKVLARLDVNEATMDKVLARLDINEATLDKVLARVDVNEATLNEHSGVLHEHSRLLNEHSGVLNEHSGLLHEHSRMLHEHSRMLHENSQLIKESTNQTIRHIDMIHEFWRSEFRALNERDREILGQVKDLQAERENVNVRLDVLTTSYRSLDKRVTTLEGKPGRKR